MKRYIFSIIAGLLLLPLAQANFSTLSDCRLRGWDTSRAKQDHSLEIVEREDGCAARFEIRSGETKIHSGWRAEIKDRAPLREGATIRYKFETFLPSELQKAGTTRLVLAQWHDKKTHGRPAQRPPLTVRLDKGKLIFVLFNQRILDEMGNDSKGVTIASVPAAWNKWTEIEVRARWEATNFGLIDIYVNGKFVRRFKGPTAYPGDRYSPYFKLGIYTVHGFKGSAHVLHRKVSRRIYNYGPEDPRTYGTRK
jgi:hypothetical protein